MANTCYDNFFLSNEIEDQYQSHLDLQQFCTVDNNLTGVAGMVRKIHKYDLYLGKLAVACTVFPNLNDKELQDSYKVMGADALLKTMLTPGEYAEYLTKIQEVCGFDTTMQDEVDEAKN